jgi:ABC-type sugar transport system ATPase subunit
MNLLPGKLSKQDWKIVSDCINYPIPRELHPQLAGVADHTPVLLGIRPEDIQIELAPLPGTLAATVYISEVLGKETLLTLACGQIRVRAIVGAMVRLDIGTPVWMCPTVPGIRIFDAATEALIASGAA